MSSHPLSVCYVALVQRGLLAHEMLTRQPILYFIVACRIAGVELRKTSTRMKTVSYMCMP